MLSLGHQAVERVASCVRSSSFTSSRSIEQSNARFEISCDLAENNMEGFDDAEYQRADSVVGAPKLPSHAHHSRVGEPSTHHQVENHHRAPREVTKTPAHDVAVLRSCSQEEAVLDSHATNHGLPLHPSPAADGSTSKRTIWTFLRILLWKNWILKRRRWMSTLLELLVPMCFVLFLSGLKMTTQSVHVPAGWSTPENVSTTDYTHGKSFNLYDPKNTLKTSLSKLDHLPKFVFHEASVTGLLLLLATMSFADGFRLDELSPQHFEACRQGLIYRGAVSMDPNSPFAIPVECENKVSPYKIALVPDNLFTRQYFFETVRNWYPRIELVANDSRVRQVPSLEDSVVFFNDSTQLEDYVTSKAYGLNASQPRIYGAVEFVTFPSTSAQMGQFDSFEYSLRFNSTPVQGLFSFVPRTNGDPAPVATFQKKLSVTNTFRYSMTGFMTFQTLVTRFLNCMPHWNATSQSSTGLCQRPQAVARESPLLNAQLFKSLLNDSLLTSQLGTILAFRSFPEKLIQSYPDLLSPPIPEQVFGVMDPKAQQQLVFPLRFAPQPAFGGGNVAPFAIDEYVSTPFYSQIGVVFVVFLVLSYLYILSRILGLLIQEKELKLRELMKILGVPEFAIVTSWYVTYVAMFSVVALLQMAAGYLGVFEHSDGLLVFVFFWCYGLSVLAYGFMVSAIFSNARTGSFAGLAVYFVMYFVSFSYPANASEQTKLLGCVLPPVAFNFGLLVINDLEANGVGLNYANAFALNGNFRFVSGLALLLFDFALYTLLGVYLQLVMPKEFGTNVNWYEPLLPRFYLQKASRHQKKRLSIRDRHASLRQSIREMDAQARRQLEDLDHETNPNMEQVGHELKSQENAGESLQIRNIRKVFGVPRVSSDSSSSSSLVGTKIALAKVTLTMYKNQITCLLGHNGAGKSTLISILTGMLAPTSGEAFFHGYRFTQDIKAIRQSLGICFQHDVLFHDLTVQEHLEFFAKIKGFLTKDGIDQVVSRQIQSVGLTEKKLVLSNQLSGGMKRKLCVAIALLGDSSLVFLDEPTSGMDPYSRRSTWEILLNNRLGRVMVLTTHFMDEADILGDRIAIMAEGTLRCCGSSLFLKNRFGTGYTLTLVKQDHGRHRLPLGGTETSLASSDAQVEHHVTSFIQSYVPNAKLLSHVGAELSFQLPLDSSHCFAAMFECLDDQLPTFGLLSYGVSVTTLEEVFIKVAEAADEELQQDAHTIQRRFTCRDSRKFSQDLAQARQAEECVHTVEPTTPKADQVALDVHEPIVSSDSASHDVAEGSAALDLSGCDASTSSIPFVTSRNQLFVIHLKALLRKRFQVAKRDRQMMVFGSVLPTVLLLTGLWMLSKSNTTRSDPKYALTTNDFPPNEEYPTPFACQQDSGPTPWCQQLMNMGTMYNRTQLEEVPLPRPFYSSNSPTVFGVTYASPPIENNDTSGACLRLGQEIFVRGYGKYAANGTDPTSHPPPKLPRTRNQFGGFLVYGASDLQVLSYNLLINTTATHGPVIYKSFIDEAMYRYFAAGAGNSITSANALSTTQARALSVVVNSHPLPLTASSRAYFASFLSFMACIFIVIAFTFFPVAIIMFLIKEKQPQHNAKHQQFVSGVSLQAFWLSNYLWDIGVFLVPMTAASVLIQVFDIAAFTGHNCISCSSTTFVGVVVLFVLFGLAICPFTYVLSYVMNPNGSYLAYTSMINAVVGVVLMVASYLFNTIEATKSFNAVMVYVWRLSPLFCLGNALFNLSFTEINASLQSNSRKRSPFEMDIMGTEMVYLMVLTVVLYSMTVGIDKAMTSPWFRKLLVAMHTKLVNCCRRNSQRPDQSSAQRHRKNVEEDGGDLTCSEDDDEQEDIDVLRERKRVYSMCSSNHSNAGTPTIGAERPTVQFADSTTSAAFGGSYAWHPAANTHGQVPEPDIVQLVNLRKVYGGKKIAVKNLSFGLAKGECFGFLGINGAGKTTTMKMLTGDILPTSGHGTLHGFDVLTQQTQIRRLIGYCPQFDALFELMTVREHLELYARIKGIPESMLEQTVQEKMKQLNLMDFEHKLAGSLSGGNKRKLSVAMALIGDPQLVFLDEPSTGMDPVSRRFMWQVISRISTQGKRCTVILTTHSMEECEALCSKVGIMVGGKLRCLGSVQHLKNRFGDGVVLDVKLDLASDERIDKMVQRVLCASEDQHEQEQQATPTQRKVSRQKSQSRSRRTSSNQSGNADATGLFTKSWRRLGQLVSGVHDNDADLQPRNALLVYPEELAMKCKTLGFDPQLVHRVVASHPTGYNLAAAMEKDGFVKLETLCNWLLGEVRFDELLAFLAKSFGSANVQVLERQNDLCRFKLTSEKAPSPPHCENPSPQPTSPGKSAHTEVPASLPTLRLCHVFSSLESHKRELEIQEYSVSQTTLEQIFNFFASQQQEETNVARGVVASGANNASLAAPTTPRPQIDHL